jgi:hypothetical protein
VVIQLVLLFSGRRRIAVDPRHVKLVPSAMWTVCRLSGTGLLQILISTSSWIGLVRVISMFGSSALAGYTIGIRTVVFAILPAWGLSNASATMVGQALGAGKPDRAEQAVWTAGFYNAVVLGSVGAVFVLFAPRIVGIYTADPKIVPHAIDCLRIVSAGFVFFAYGLVFTQSFNGAGDTWTPTWINLACFWLLQIPLAWLLAIHLQMGPRGVYIAITVAFSTLAVSAVSSSARDGGRCGGSSREKSAKTSFRRQMCQTTSGNTVPGTQYARGPPSSATHMHAPYPALSPERKRTPWGRSSTHPGRSLSCSAWLAWKRNPPKPSPCPMRSCSLAIMANCRS